MDFALTRLMRADSDSEDYVEALSEANESKVRAAIREACARAASGGAS